MLCRGHRGRLHQALGPQIVHYFIISHGAIPSPVGPGETMLGLQESMWVGALLWCSVAKNPSSRGRGLGAIPGQGTRSPMSQRSIHTPQLTVPPAATKIKDSVCHNQDPVQPNKRLKKKSLREGLSYTIQAAKAVSGNKPPAGKCVPIIHGSVAGPHNLGKTVGRFPCAPARSECPRLSLSPAPGWCSLEGVGLVRVPPPAGPAGLPAAGMPLHWVQ